MWINSIASQNHNITYTTALVNNYCVKCDHALIIIVIIN